MMICRDHLTGAQKLAAEGSVVLGGMPPPSLVI